jgi:hypothetical protein
LAIAAVAVLGPGCGKVTPGAADNGDAGNDGGGADAQADVPITTDDGCNREAQAICNALADCAMVWVQYLYGDKVTCVARLARSCNDEQKAMGVTRTPDDLAACGADVATTSCADLLASRFPASCQVKPGTIENGVGCGTDWQCASGYCGKKNSDCGVCGPRAALGGDCTADDGCQQGMVCANNKCAVPADLNGPCNLPNQPCRSDLFCTGDGRCAAKLGAGETCRGLLSADCDIFHGFVCNGLLTGTCAQVTVAKGGEACGGGTSTICQDLNPCTGSTATQTGLCAAPAGDGEACGGSGQSNCLPPATCVMNVCRLPSAPACH